MTTFRRLAFVALLVVVGNTSAQQTPEGRPAFLEPGTPSQAELDRQKADNLLREARTLYGVGVLHRRQDRMIEATKMLEKALAADPESTEIRKTLIPLFITLGREDEALALGREVLRSRPTDVGVSFQTARLLRGAGKFPEAISVLQRASQGKEAEAKPEGLLLMLSDLYDLHERDENYAAGADAQERIILTIAAHREQLLFGNGFTKDDLLNTLAKAHERLGRCCLHTKNYARATTAFRTARDTLMKVDDPDARRLAGRINWNICEMAAAQEKWAEAMEALDAYLEFSPTELPPYEKKAELLRKLGRERDVVPAIRKLATREEFHLGVQLLLAKELGKDIRTRREAERMCLSLLEKQIKPDIYRTLFKLYQSEDRMNKVLDLLDDAVRVANSKEGEARLEEREAAQERARAMITVLRTEPALVTALLPVSLEELQRVGEKRSFQAGTWVFLGTLAARVKQLDKAELYFRQSLVNVPLDLEYQVYAGLLEVLRLEKKHEEIIKLCNEAINGRRPAKNTNLWMFQSSLASAHTELGDFTEALKAIDAAVKLSSEDTKMRTRCHKAEVLSRAGRHPEAIAECQETLKEFPRPDAIRTVRYALSNCYSNQGDHAKSEEQLRLILETDPNAPLANNNLGYQLADRNVKLDEAEKLIRRAIELEQLMRKDAPEEGENAAYLDSLGWVLFRRGEMVEAKAWLEKAALLPDGADDPTVWDHLGDVCAKLNDMNRAKQAWQTALKLYQGAHKRNNDARRVEVEKKLKTLPTG
ncbi:tetratricopeptide repeat protein [Zavarzinella formosa]|uniref:tetratricopeptide repeat protein n=1 Tax=Zavarzinella formosa TaxID=360055 RepID=UPI00030580F3|nr:tetratricopeptide repeat protein [Zavarzinella formosa]